MIQHRRRGSIFQSSNYVFDVLFQRREDDVQMSGLEGGREYSVLMRTDDFAENIGNDAALRYVQPNRIIDHACLAFRFQVRIGADESPLSP